MIGMLLNSIYKKKREEIPEKLLREYQLDFIIQRNESFEKEELHIVRYTWIEEDYILMPKRTLCSLKVEQEVEDWKRLEEDNINSDNYDLPESFDENFIKDISQYFFVSDLPKMKIDPDTLAIVEEISEVMVENAIVLRFEGNFAICKECMAALMERGSKKVLDLIVGQNNF